MIRKDGFYINYKTGTSNFGESFELTLILVFTKNDLVYFEEMDGIVEPNEIKDDIQEIDFGTKLSSTLGQFTTKKDMIKVIFPLGSISNIDNEYKELIGSYTENLLILNYNICNWSEMRENYYKRTLIENLEFKFYSTAEKRYIESANKYHQTNNTDRLKDFENKSRREIQYNRERNFTIAFVFGLIAGIIGAIFGGVSGFFIGAIIGVIIGFILKSILD